MKNQAITFQIDGLGRCEDGACTVERALAVVSGVASVYVNAVAEMAYVEYDPTRLGPHQLVISIEHAGFCIVEFDHWCG
ncbi:MAG: heavy-metal-associated domain-containing protein [Ardenticatenaceae bacterium]|nr:heavy-metal-associated domain-containing protein [Ardenticatenaceae bacterium]HBY96726.1 hypothetical protein [Chloroflexota bacterium]